MLETKYGKIIRATPQASGTNLFCRLPYTKKPSPIEPNSNPQRRDDASKKRLTVKLRGRTTTPDQRRGRTLSSGARGAQPPTHHGPFQRLLGRTCAEPEPHGPPVYDVRPNGELRGRAPTPAKRRGHTMLSSARGAHPPTYHGPLQRLLERMQALKA